MSSTHTAPFTTPTASPQQLQPNVISVVWFGDGVGAQEVGQQAVEINEEEDQIVSHPNDWIPHVSLELTHAVDLRWVIHTKVPGWHFDILADEEGSEGQGGQEQVEVARQQENEGQQQVGSQLGDHPQIESVAALLGIEVITLQVWQSDYIVDKEK